MTPEPSGDPASPLRLQSLPRRALVIAPIRLALACIGLVAAIVAGSREAGALLAFGGATMATLLLVIADPRARFFQIPESPPEAPADASEDGLGRLALSAAFPSTIGVAALLAVTLAAEPTLAAVMAGILAGLGLAALVGAYELQSAERRRERRLYVERGTSRVLARPYEHENTT
jgi:hypothetical protein